MEPVTKLAEVRDAMAVLHAELPYSPGLANRLGQAHAFYVLPDMEGKSRFGFSKFVGYPGLTAEKYLNNYKKLDGRNTEHALSPWFVEVHPNSSTYTELYEELADWLSTFGKRPRGGKVHHARIKVLKPEFAETNSEVAEDRTLLDLLICVAKKLPISQRHELRAAL